MNDPGEHDSAPTSDKMWRDDSYKPTAPKVDAH